MPKGHVSLVGAGPGAADLVTVRAAERLAEADVVLYDQLVPDAVVEAWAPQAYRERVGRRAQGPPSPGETVVSRLVGYARKGLAVVRLHQGDPGLYGRAADEIQALIHAGVPWEWVPGVSAMLAAPAAAGIPLTRRSEARHIWVTTAHTMNGVGLPRVPKGPAWTGVILMGRDQQTTIRDELLAQGWDPNTPVVVVGAAAQPAEVVYKTTVRRLPVSMADLLPTTVIVGAAAEFPVKEVRPPNSVKGSINKD